MKREAHTVAFRSFDVKSLVRFSFAVMRSACILSYASVTKDEAKGLWVYRKMQGCIDSAQNFGV